MGERIIKPHERYYAGGTVPKIAGSNGVVEPEAMAAAQYPDDKNQNHKHTKKVVYAGGTVPKAVKDEEDTDDMGRTLFR